MAADLKESTAEQHVLGSLMIDPEAIPLVKAKLSAADFYEIRHQWIYEAICEIGADTDLFTVANALTEKGRLIEVGGDLYLMDLMGGIPTALNVGAYADIVARLAERRRLVAVSQGILRLAYDLATPVEDIYGSANDSLAKASTARATVHESLVDVASDVLTDYELERQRKGKLEGISCGVSVIDAYTSGWLPTRLIIIAGRPGQGKSILMAQSALRAASQGHGTIMYSLEMSPRETLMRMAKNRAGISYGVGQAHTLSEAQDKLMRDTIANLTELPLSIRYASSIEQILAEVEIEARSWTGPGKAGTKLALVVIDQLQNLSPEEDDGSTRDAALSRVTRALKQMAMRLGIAVQLGSALNRTAEGVQPTLGSLRECGGIESDADQVLGLHTEDPDMHPETLSVIMLKNRIGAKGTAKVKFVKGMHRLMDFSTERLAI